MKNRKKVTALLLAGILAGSSAIGETVQAAADASEKDEVVYVNLDGSGKVEETFVVNSFRDSEITDFGTYSQVKNMNTTDTIIYENGEIAIQRKKAEKEVPQKLYYEGKIDMAQIPWNLEVTYKIDKTVYAPEDISGKSGKLEIDIMITKNPKAAEGFFENYALQAVLKLDTEKCQNIQSEGATLANVGKLKQLTYTVMPGKEKHILVTADVIDFEMEGIAVNGMRLNLGIDSDMIDTSEIDAKISKLQDAAAALDDGAESLKGGADELDSGAKTLKEGIETIQNALNNLNQKSSSLTAGSGQVKGALETIQNALQSVSISAQKLEELRAASAEIKEGIYGIKAGLQQVDMSIDTYYEALKEAGLEDTNGFAEKHSQALAAMGITDTQRILYQAYQMEGNQGLMTKIAELAAAGDSAAQELETNAAGGNMQAVMDYIEEAAALISVEMLLKADISYIQGSAAVIDGIDAGMGSNGQLMAGADKLQEGYRQFDLAIQDMVSSLENLAVNMGMLKSGVNTLREDYDVLDGGIGQYTEVVNQITQGYVQVYQGAGSLIEGTSQLCGGIGELAEGTNQFAQETAGMQAEVNTTMDSMVSEFADTDFLVTSFCIPKKHKGRFCFVCD